MFSLGPSCSYVDTHPSQVFLNIVLDEAVEEKDGGEKVRLGMVVWLYYAQRLLAEIH